MIEQYHLNSNVNYRLAQNTCAFDTDSAEDQIIYIRSKPGEQKQISGKQACEAIVPYVKNWLNMTDETCAPIIESGDIHYLLNGEGCEIPSLQELLHYLDAPTQIYVSQIIGVRDRSYIICLGLFYNWREQMAIRRDERVCRNPQGVEGTMDTVTKKSSVGEEGGFTRKLRSILLNDR